MAPRVAQKEVFRGECFKRYYGDEVEDRIRFSASLDRGVIDPTKGLGALEYCMKFKNIMQSITM